MDLAQPLGSQSGLLQLQTEHVRVIPAMFSFVSVYRRSVAESWTITTLVAPQRQADAAKYWAPLQEMKY